MKMDIVFTLTIYALGMVLAAVGSRLSARCTVWCCALCGLPMRARATFPLPSPSTEQTARLRAILAREGLIAPNGADA